MDLPAEGGDLVIPHPCLEAALDPSGIRKHAERFTVYDSDGAVHFQGVR